MPRILVATPKGLHTFDARGVSGPLHHDGRDVTGLAPAWPDLWAVIGRTEVWQAADPDGWTHVADLETNRATCIVAVGEDVFVGSSEARLFRLAGRTLEPVAPFDQAEGRAGWYTPWGGPPDTRSMANWDQAIYVNVHVGGILRTDDGGESWRPTI